GLKAEFPAYYASNPDQPRAHQSHGVKLRNGRVVVLGDQRFGVRRDELEFAIYDHHRVKGRAGRHPVQGYVQRAIRSEGAMQVHIPERQTTARTAAEAQTGETTADGVNRSAFRE